MKFIFQRLAVLFLCGVACAREPVRIDFFYEPGCQECERLESELLPRIEKRFPGACAVHFRDVGIETNFIELLRFEDSLGYTAPERAYLLVDRRYLFGSGFQPEEFFAVISNLLQSGESAGTVPEDVSAGAAGKRFREFTLPAVIAAGLIDGVNPCAFSTLVFFMSLLAVSKVRKRQLILLGVSFCAAVFLTYLGIGFGLFRILHLFSGFVLLRTVLEWGMFAGLLVLAGLSFRDAARFAESGNAADVTLQLSIGMKKRIHNVMRRGIGSVGVVSGGLLIGTVVTVIESVCTGQVYVPVLVLILKESAFSEFRAWMLLLLYNTLFVLPLVILFAAVYFGLRTEKLLVWSRRNVVPSKILLGLLFTVLAILMVCL
jgi:hypothetical protein